MSASKASQPTESTQPSSAASNETQAAAAQPDAPVEASSAPTAAEEAPIEAQGSSDEVSSETDSALGSEYDESTYTASLSSSITAYQYEHGRRYHANHAVNYDLPNDENEQERMDLQYHALRLAFGDKLFFAPIDDSPATILDIGTGTGIWVIDIAEALPDTQIIGTDLSPIQPGWVPPNAKFEVDNAELPWTFPADHFDLVHTRIMNAFVQDWNRLMEQSYRHLKPGGWVECHELSVDVRSDDGTLPEDSHIHQWCLNEGEAWRKIGLSVTLSGEEVADWMEKAGFVNVTIKRFKLPIGTWPKDKQLRETGAFQLVAMLEGIQGLTIAPWVRHLGWNEQEVEVFVAKVRNEWKSGKFHTYFPLYAVYGQKPRA
ncbi:uncharacterized protein KY384_003281 [Bacidia gigantensis]|uniref:uncharacterized protein n=1 Tax=Bacidia gigantensis TaxID=2732470 RepID=UPI001D0585F1|nr:uncharacterized protein KY384_003281 [Bacidia gigantensis]KAG8531650.1 hypothetical protein KY384_003281 [Bacidia gigantensis]